MKEFIQKRLPLLGLVVVSIIALTGFSCRRPGALRGGAGSGDSLVVWGLWQDSAMVKPVIDAFEDQTGVAVEYRKIGSVATYERMLFEALAEGRGPDVFVIHHTWVESKRGIMSPAPSEVISARTLQEEFVDVATDDLVRDGLVYALPTSVDTMAMYYNQDLLNSASVARPPRTWQEFQQVVEQLTRVTRLGIIEQSAGAIGTAGNVNRAPDILELLMRQSGLDIARSNGDGSFDFDIVGEIGERALTFYTDFSNKSKKVYTWDLQQDFSIDAFSEGETAIMFNYSYHLPTITAKNPRLRFGIAPMPQIADSTPLTFANYWPFAVSNTSTSPRTAWQFLRFMTNTNAAKTINSAQGAPPARRDSIDGLREDPQMGVFAEQALTATSWPRLDVVATDAIFNTMIDDVVTGAATVPDSLRRAEDQLEQIGGGV